MAAHFQASDIKLEEQSENVTEIQSYLAGFQKEIGSDVAIQQVSDEVEDEEEGTYFVDQAGRYYFQAKGDAQPVMTVVSTPGISSVKDDGEYLINAEDKSDVDGEHGTSGNILINTGDTYQRVSLVPSEDASAEMSYVLIVQDPSDMKDGEGDGDQDMAVYDFDEAEEGGVVDSDMEDDKSKIVRILPRKSQVAAQAHMCNYCNYTSSKRYLLSRHMKSHSEERPHKCNVCERGFKTLASLQNHVNTHTGTKPHSCKFCAAAFTTSGELVRHVRYRHTHEKPHKCDECDYASVELSKLKRHIRCHTGERPYQCPHCTYASPDTFKLKRHLRIHTGEKPYKCDECLAKFTQSNSLKAHKLIHNVGEKPVFHCELCPATCGRKTDLRIHVQKLHTSDAPLKCKRCGKSFPDRYSFKLHNKTHDGEKCFKCDLCPYATISARHLENHMLVHTDQKPFSCSHCDQRFRQRQLLKRHENLYHNPDYVPPAPKEKNHECPECSRAFRHRGNLIRHMSAHDPDPAIQKKQLELKLGRQKKIQMIDGQQVEVMPNMSSENEEEEMDMMAVEGSDGQQYVVLEVIQLGDGDEQAMVVGEGSREIVGETLLPSHELNGDIMNTLENVRRIPKNEDDNDEAEKKYDPSTQTDMLNCFGFDEDEEDDDSDSKERTITLLGGVN